MMVEKKEIFAEKKPWWKSKTLIVNVLLIGGGLLTGVAEIVSAGQAVSITAVANLLLRLMTKQQLKA